MKDNSIYFPVDQMAKILGVSKSGYYGFLKRSVSSRSQYNQELVDKIKEVFSQSFEIYGSPLNWLSKVIAVQGYLHENFIRGSVRQAYRLGMRES
jgi:hypothetical protein